ncbi:MAG: hypothetical protein JWN76_430 [Chitinophagaceae bacterium]|nr:hypothetical protein [Chitinophagaceae bacterium]
MKKNTVIIGCFALLFFTGCKVLEVNYKTLPPEIKLADSTGTIVVIDAAEIHTPGLINTKKREAVVTEIKVDYVKHMPDAIRNTLGNTAVTDTSLNDEEKILLLGDNPAIKEKIFSKYNASAILVLVDCSGGFTQDEVVKQKKQDGSTSKEAYYSVFFQAKYHIIQSAQSWNKEVYASRKHSSRSVLSGLLARGPGYEANQKDIAEMAHQNAAKTAGLFKAQTIATNGWRR